MGQKGKHDDCTNYKSIVTWGKVTGRVELSLMKKGNSIGDASHWSWMLDIANVRYLLTIKMETPVQKGSNEVLGRGSNG